MNLQTHIKRTLIQAILIFAGILLTMAAKAQVHVALNGHVVLQEQASMNDITVTLINDADSTIMNLPRNGAFSSLVPVQDSLIIIVSCPGHISKEVVIDLGNNADLAFIEQVRFNVVLEKQPAERELVYSGPIGMVDLGKRAKDGQPKFIHIQQQKMDRAQSAYTASR